MYGTSPELFTPCGNIAPFGDAGPVGTTGSCAGVAVLGTGGLVGGVFPLCAPGEDENLDEILDNHEFRRPAFGDGDGGFGMLPFNIAVFSVEMLLEKPGRWGFGFGAVGATSFA